MNRHIDRINRWYLESYRKYQERVQRKKARTEA